MVSVKIYEGPEYWVGKEYHTDYIRIEWDDGYVDMKKYHWDKLTQKQRDTILKLDKKKKYKRNTKRFY